MTIVEVIKGGAARREVERRDLAAQVARAVDLVENSWGSACAHPITVDVSDKHPIPMALTPAWRGHRGLFLLPTSRIHGNLVPAVHEACHVCLPNGNRFLAEGLAVHLQDALGDNPAYPNYGRSLDVLLRETPPAFPLAAFDAIATPGHLGDPRSDGKIAYWAAGSFVRYLIAVYGLDRFKVLYSLTPFRPGERVAVDPDRYAPIFGHGLGPLEARWRSWAKLDPALEP